MWTWGERFEVGAALGDALLAGEWESRPMLERAGSVLAVGGRPRWLAPLVERSLEAYRERPADRRREFHAWLDGQLATIARRGKAPAVAGRLFPKPAMGRARWPVPTLASARELAEFLTLDSGELAWLADVRGLERTASSEQLRNYRYRWVPRRGGLPRPLERPKPLLKDVQRAILRGILNRVPPHPDAHGFRRGHSAVTHARRHAGQRVVIGFDLEDFFVSIPVARVYGIFRGCGYPETVAHRLAGLCTNVVPLREWRACEGPQDASLVDGWHRLGRRLAAPHLPQGAPTSPALATTWPPTGSTADCQAWRPRWVRATRATPTT